jgi:hypothetical protein
MLESSSKTSNPAISEENLNIPTFHSTPGAKPLFLAPVFVGAPSWSERRRQLPKNDNDSADDLSITRPISSGLRLVFQQASPEQAQLELVPGLLQVSPPL